MLIYKCIEASSIWKYKFWIDQDSNILIHVETQYNFKSNGVDNRVSMNSSYFTCLFSSQWFIFGLEKP